MANDKAVVLMDNFVQSGDLSLEQMVADVAAVNGGTKPGVAQIVRDSTGKLVQVELTFPDTVSQNAIDAINRNRGKAKPAVAIPTPWRIDDLNPGDGMVWSGAALSATQVIQAQIYGGSGPLGILSSSGYTDYPIQDSAGELYFDINITLGGSSLVLDSGFLTFKTAAGKIVPVVMDNPYTVANATDQVSCWVAADGKLYLRAERINGQWVTLLLTFDEAVTANPNGM